LTSSNGGGRNAFTSRTQTNYFFNIKNSQFKNALDIFSRFFTEPLFSKKYVEKEMNAVNSEFELFRNNDGWREDSIFARTSNPESIFNGFGIGNLKTLNKPNIYEKLKTFYDTYYRYVFYFAAIFNFLKKF
jgi:insulysin